MYACLTKLSKEGNEKKLYVTCETNDLKHWIQAQSDLEHDTEARR